MIACVCRNIKDSSYDTLEALKLRIMQDDAVCGKCQVYYKRTERAVNSTANYGVSRLG